MLKVDIFLMLAYRICNTDEINLKNQITIIQPFFAFETVKIFFSNSNLDTMK